MASDSNKIIYELQVVDNATPVFAKVEKALKGTIPVTEQVGAALDKLQSIKTNTTDIDKLTKHLKELQEASKVVKAEMDKISTHRTLITDKNVIPSGRRTTYAPEYNVTGTTGKVNIGASLASMVKMERGLGDIDSTIGNAQAQLVSRIGKLQYLEKEYAAVHNKEIENLRNDFKLMQDKAAFRGRERAQFDKLVSESMQANAAEEKAIQSRKQNLEQTRHAMFFGAEAIRSGKVQGSLIEDKPIKYQNIVPDDLSARLINAGLKLNSFRVVYDNLWHLVQEKKLDIRLIPENIGYSQNILQQFIDKYRALLQVITSSASGQQASSLNTLKMTSELLSTVHTLQMYRDELLIAHNKLSSLDVAMLEAKAAMQVLNEAMLTNTRQTQHQKDAYKEAELALRNYERTLKEIKSIQDTTERRGRFADETANATNKLKAQLNEEAIIRKNGADSVEHLEFQKAQKLQSIWDAYNSVRKANIEQMNRLEITGNAARDRAAEAGIRKSMAANTQFTATAVRATEAEYNSRIQAVQALRQHTNELLNHSDALITNERASQHLLTRIFQFDIGYRIANNALNAFSNTLHSIPAVGIAWESANATFRAVFNTTEEVGKQFEFLDGLALKTGASITVLREQFGQFASSAKFSGESIGKIQQIFTDITMAGTVLHLPADKLKSAFIAINQMYAKNQVMMEELKKQLGNQLPAAVAIFAMSVGKTTKQLMEDMKKGLVFPKESIAQFAATYRDFFADTSSFAQAAKGLNSELGRLSSSWTYLSQAIYEDVSGVLVGAVRGLTVTLNTIRENLTAVGIAGSLAFGAGAVSFLNHYITRLAVAATTAATANKAFKALAATNAIGSTASAIERAAAATSMRAMSTTATSGTFFGKLAILLPDLLANLAKFAKITAVITAITGTIVGVKNITGQVGDTTITVGDIVATAWGKMKTAATGYYDYLAENTKKYVDVGLQLAASGADKLAGYIWTNITSMDFSHTPFTKSKKLTEFIFGSDLAKETAENAKKAAAILAAQLESDKIAGALKESIIRGSELGGEEMTQVLTQKINKYLEIFNKVSESIIATADLQVKVGLHAIQMEQQEIEKQFKANKVSFLDYYQKRLELVEREYQITLKKSILEKDVASYGIGEARRFKEATDLNYSQVSTNELDKIKKQDAMFTALGQAKVLMNDKVSITKDGAKLLEAQQVAADAALKKMQESLQQIEKDNATKKPEEQTTISPIQRDIMGLAKAPMFYQTDMERAKARQDLYNTEQAEGIAKTQRNLYESTVAMDNQLIAGVDSKATILKEAAARMKLIEGKGDVAAKVTEIATAEGVKNVNAYLANVTVESSLNKGAISPAGAVGIAQVMPNNKYAKGLDLSTLEGSATAGARYWKELETKYGNDLVKVAAAYNAGKGAVDSGKYAKYPETVNHINRVVALNEQLARKMPSEIAPIELDRTKGGNYGTYVGNEFKGEAKIIQANSKLLDAQYTKEKALAELELLRTEYIDRTREAYVQSNIEVLKLTDGNAVQISMMENELKYHKELDALDKMKEAHSKLDTKAKEAKTEEERKLIELLRSQTIPLSKEELATQIENTNELKERAKVLAEVAEYRRTTGIQKEAMSLAEKDISLGQGAGKFGDFGAMYRRSSLAQSQYATLSAGKEAEYAKIRQENTDPNAAENKIKEFNQGLEETRQKGEELNNYFANNISQSIGTAMTDWATGNKSVEDSLRSLGAAFLKMVMDMIVQEIILTGVRLALKAASAGIFGGGGEVGASGKAAGGIVGYAGGGNILAFPSGGRVHGVGSETSDSNLALVPKGSYIIKASSSNKLAGKNGNMLVRLSNNETVIPPDMVNAYGKDFFEHANNTGELKFASGGAVGIGGTGNVVKFPTTGAKHTNNSTNNIVVNVQSNGKESSDEMGQKISIEIVKQIAKAEAKREVNVNNKMQKVNSKRVA